MPRSARRWHISFTSEFSTFRSIKGLNQMGFLTLRLRPTRKTGPLTEQPKGRDNATYFMSPRLSSGNNFTGLPVKATISVHTGFLVGTGRGWKPPARGCPDGTARLSSFSQRRSWRAVDARMKLKHWPVPENPEQNKYETCMPHPTRWQLAIQQCNLCGKMQCSTCRQACTNKQSLRRS